VVGKQYDGHGKQGTAQEGSMRFLGAGGKMGFGREDYALLIPTTTGQGSFAPAAYGAGMVIFDEEKDYFTKFRDLYLSRFFGVGGSISPAVLGRNRIADDNYLYIANVNELYLRKDGQSKQSIFGPIGGSVKNVVGISLDENQELEILDLGDVDSLSSVSCLEKGTSGDIYIGGNFTTFDGVSNTRRIAKWDGTSENIQALSTGIDVLTAYDSTKYVYSIAFKSNSEIYASYTKSTTETEIFEYDGSSWSSLGTANSNETLLAIDEDNNLLACGDFTNMAGLTATRIAVYDTSTSSWTAPYEPGFNSRVRALHRGPTGQDTYFSGAFTTIQGVSATYATKKPDGTTAWVDLGSGFGTTIAGSGVSENGNFYAIETESVTLTNFRKRKSDGTDSFVDRSQYAPNRIVGTSGFASNYGRDILTIGSKIFVFTTLDFTYGDKLTDHDSLSYTRKRMDRGKFYTGSSQISLSAPVFFYIYNDKLHWFRSALGYYWNGSSWTSFLSTNGDIYDAIQVGSDLYVTGNGNFNNMVNRITKWDGSSFSQLGSGLNSTGLCLATDGINLYVGGSFTTAGGVTVNRVAKWDGSSWSAMNTGTVGMNGAVRGLAWDSTDEKLYAVGNFTTAGGATANRIAVWDSATETWSAVGTSGLNSFARSIAIDEKNRHVYIEGEFTTADGATRNNLTRWNINTSAFDNLSFPGAGLNFSQTDNHNYIYWDEIKERLYVSKFFYTISDNKFFSGICYWDGKTNSWETIRQYNEDSFSGAGSSARGCYRIFPVKTKDIENFDSL
jgi:hypothetical protein